MLKAGRLIPLISKEVENPLFAIMQCRPAFLT